MARISGKRILVTGASGLVALPVARELAKDNEVQDPVARRFGKR